MTRVSSCSPFGPSVREKGSPYRRGGRVAQERSCRRPKEGCQRKAEDGATGCPIHKVRDMGQTCETTGPVPADNFWSRQLTCDVEFDVKASASVDSCPLVSSMETTSPRSEHRERGGDSEPLIFRAPDAQNFTFQLGLHELFQSLAPRVCGYAHSAQNCEFVVCVASLGDARVQWKMFGCIWSRPLAQPRRRI